MTTRRAPAPATGSRELDVISEWRTQAGELASQALLLLVALATAWVTVDAAAGRDGFLFPVFAAALGVLLLLYWCRRRFTLTQRFSVTLAMTFGVIATSVLSNGFNTPNQFLALLVLVIAAELTLSPRMTLVFQCAAVGIVALGAVWFVVVRPATPGSANPYLAANWARVLFIFTGILTVASVCLRHMINRLRSALTESAQLLTALQEETAARLKEEHDARLLQSRFEHTQRFEALGRLAGGVAHDFNNLLTVIMASAESLEQLETQSEPSETSRLNELKRESLESIMTSAQKGSELTHELMALGGKYGTHHKLMHLNEVIAGTCSLLRGSLPNNVRLEPDLQAVDVWVRVCPGDLTQVVMNLVVNARDAMPNGGHIHVTTRQAETEPRNQVLLTISDTGTGMTEDVKRRVFDAYFTTKPEGQGYGLGLSIVDGVVKRLGGSINVETAPGHGTSFVIRLPAAEASA